MTQTRGAVRRRRSAPTIGVTGTAGVIGGALIERLSHHQASFKLVALDTVRRHAPGVTWRVADVRDPALATRLAGLDVLIHLATDRTQNTPVEDRRAVNIRGTEVLLDAAKAVGVSRVVLLSSAMVYGAHPANAIPLDEASPRLSEPVDGLVGDWVAMEAAAMRRTTGDQPLEVTVIRPASLVGPAPDALLPGMFQSVRLLAIRDATCRWQFCHLDDLLDALVAAALGDVTGAVTVGCEGSLSQREVEAIAGMRSVVLPSSVAFATAERLHRVGALASPASDLLYLVHPWVVGSQQLRESGWSPRWTNEAALRDHLRRLGDRAGRGLVVVDRKDATRAAAGAAAGAGATLAVIGSLALARARRKR
jgi:nucleoside-diphosphate-sugar epimerase